MHLNRLAVDVPGQMLFQLHTPDEEGIWWFRAVPDLGLQFDQEGEEPARAFTFHERGSQRVCPRVQGEGATLPDAEAVATLCKLDARREALASLGALRLSGSIRMVQSGVTGEFAWLVDGPERYATEVDFGIFALIRAAYGDGVGTESGSLNPLETLSGKRLLHARQDNPLMACTDWRLFADSYEVVGREDLDGRTVLLVRLVTEGLPALTLSVDAETGDTLEQDGKHEVPGLGVQLPYTIRFENYREVKGLRIPFRTVRSDDASGMVIMELEDIETDLDIDPAVFVLTH
jgi:hypothetical protein